MSNEWFSTSRSGLRKQVKERGAARIFLEVAASNPLDERENGMTTITIQVEPVDGQPLANVVIEDNSPTGFKDLTHAYTIFAESSKRGNPELRGQFNFGEKQFLSLCRKAKIATTTGTVDFNDKGRHQYPRRKRPSGTRIDAVMEITRAEIRELEHLLHTLLLPEGVSMTYNGERLECRKPIREFKAVLPTQIADEEGVMRPTARTTTVRIYEPHDGEQPHLYELGIPVVETEIRWHVSVGQKVPLNRDRDNVTPTYVKKLHTAVAETMRESLDKEDAGSWCNIVLANKESSRELTHKLMDEKFGEVRASYDPTDSEANHKGAVNGGTIIHGRQLTKEQWDNAREKGAILPAGQLWPTPKPYSTDPNAPVAQYVPRKDWTPGMVKFHDYVCWLAEELLGVTHLTVRFPRQINARACYSKQSESKAVIDFNFNNIGRVWFDKIGVEQDELVIHEFAHHRSSSHYDDKYHEACCELGSKLKQLAMTEPDKMATFVTERQA
ncbi:MAG: hypothetical protein ACYC3X_31315 [Pirellulaceae bacterium]